MDYKLATQKKIEKHTILLGVN